MRRICTTACVKQKLLVLQVDCRAKKRKIPASVAEAVELAQELLQYDTGNSVVPSSILPTDPPGEATAFAAELEKVKARIAELESVKTITVRRHKEIHEKIEKHHSEEVLNLERNLCQKCE